MSVRVITGTVVKSNSNPETTGKTYKDGKEVVVKKSSSSSSSSKSSSTNPVTNPTAPTVANAANLPVNNVPVTSQVTPSVTSSPLITPENLTSDSSFGGGGRGSLGDTAQGYASLATGERFDTLGESLNADWNYYKPALGLALWESGAAEAVLSKASSVVSKIFNNYAPKTVGKTVNWAQEEISRTGMPAVKEAAGKVVPAVNTKTMFGVNKNLIKAGFGLTAAAYITKEVLSGKVFSDFQLAEATDKLGYVRTRANEVGDFESVAEIDAMLNDILNQNNWQIAASFIPFIGGNVGTTQNIKAAELANNVYKKIDEFNSGGLTGESYWDAINSQKMSDEKASVDYFNEQRLITEQKLIAAQAQADKESAAFWKKHQSDLDKAELAQAKAQADFWLEYDKKKAALDLAQAEQYTPSKLNFGLI